MAVFSDFVLSVSLLFAFLVFSSSCSTHNCIFACFSLCVFFFFLQFFPFGGQPKATRCEWNVGECGRGCTVDLNTNTQGEREREHVSKRVFECSFLPPVLDVVQDLFVKHP